MLTLWLSSAFAVDVQTLVDDDAVETRAAFPFPESASRSVNERCLASLTVGPDGKTTRVDVSECEAPWSDAVAEGFAAWAFAPVNDAEGKGVSATGEYVVRFRRDLRGSRVRVVPRTVVRAVRRFAAPYPTTSVSDLGTDRLICTLHVLVGADGATASSTPLDCPEPLHETTEKTLARWKWEPVGDQPYQTNVTFRFQLSAADFEERKREEQRKRDRELADVLAAAPRANLKKVTHPVDIAFPAGLKPSRFALTECEALVLTDVEGVPQGVTVTGCDDKYAETTRAGLMQYRYSPPIKDVPMQPLLQRYKVIYKRWADKRETGEKTKEEATVKERRTTVATKEVRPEWDEDAIKLDTRRCQLDLLVGQKGKVLTVQTFACPEEVVEPARTALQSWRFKPLVIDNKRVQYKTTLGIRPRGDDLEFKYIEDFDVEFPEPPAYPEDRPPADTFPMVHPASVKSKKKVPLALEDVAGLLPEQEETCKAVVYIDDKGVVFHADIDRDACPEVLQIATYRALMQFTYEPVEVEEGTAAVRFPIVVKFKPDPKPED